MMDFIDKTDIYKNKLAVYSDTLEQSESVALII